MKYYKKKCKNPYCGKEFMGTQTQQYCCHECRKLPDYKSEKKAAKDKAKEAKKVKKKKVMTIDEIATKARESGMSYGKYVETLYIQGRMDR